MIDRAPVVEVPRVLDKRALREWLGVGEHLLDDLIARGMPHIPPLGGRGRGRTILFLAPEVDRWLQSLQVRTEAAPTADPVRPRRMP